jgi:hypothetical protein
MSISPEKESLLDHCMVFQLASRCVSYLSLQHCSNLCQESPDGLLQDMFLVKGEYAVIAFISRLTEPPATKNSAIVDILLDLGAVLYCKTDIPQTGFVSLLYTR